MRAVPSAAFTHLVTDPAEIETLFTPPSAMVARKKIGHVWDPSSWPGPDVADAREVFRGHVALNSALDGS